MSAIPPNVIGSVLQSGMAQRVQSRQNDAAENAKADAAKRRGPTAVEDIFQVEATDGDTRVQTDSESGGLGSQGRYDAPPEQDAEGPAATEAEGITTDETGQPHVDLSA